MITNTKLPFLAALITATVVSLHANPPQPPLPGGRTEKFVPHSGYLRAVKRAQLERRIGPALGAPPIGGLKGTRHLPVICVSFKNVDAPHPVTSYQEMLFGAPAHRKTLTQYYRDMSNNNLNVTGRVLGWYELPKDDTYYENKHIVNGKVVGNGNGPPFGELLRIGLEEADKEADFGDYDNDGPDGFPNSGDDDGIVDTVMFVHPELGGEFQRITPDNIWSHSWHYSEPDYGHTGPFVTGDIRKDANGNPLLGANGQPQRIVVEDYVIQPGLNPPRLGQPKPIIEIGVFCHEYGHALGLPDLYDRTEDEHEVTSSGVGHWCLMAAGSYGGDGDHSGTPAAMSAWCKQYLGWANVVKVTQDGAVDLEAVSEHNQVLRLDVPGTGGKEYFLAEYRQREWQDATGARINWDEFLHASGLAVWHIDERVGATLPGGIPNPDWPFADHDAGQNDAPSLPQPGGANPAMWLESHSLVSLRQADRRLELEKGSSPGDAGDLFVTGGTWGDDSRLRCGSRNYAGEATNFTLKEINLANLTLTAGLSAEIPHIAVAPAPAPAAPVHGAPPASPTPAGAPPAALQANAVAQFSGMRAPAAVKAPVIAPEKARPLAGWSARLSKDHLLETARRSLEETTAKIAASEPVIDTSERVETVISHLNSRLAESGGPQIEEGLSEKLKTYTEKEIAAVVEPKVRPVLRSLCAQARTNEVTAESTPDTAAEKAVIDAIKYVEGNTKATVQVSPSGNQIERVTDLALPTIAPTIAADARERLASDLGKAATGDATVQETKAAALPGVVTFEQTLKIGEKVVPVWGAFTNFYYSKGAKPQLEAITSKVTAPATLNPAGKPGQLSVAKAQEIAAALLQVDPKLLTDGREGVKVPQGDPENARLAIRFLLPVAEKQRSLEVYVDSESQRIISIE